jgi:hypothetical protein
MCVKGSDLKVCPRTGHEGSEGEQRYSSTLSLTLALGGDGWSTPRPGRFTPGKETQDPLYWRLGGLHCRFGRMRKVSPSPGFDLRNVKLVPTRVVTYVTVFSKNRCGKYEHVKGLIKTLEYAFPLVFCLIEKFGSVEKISWQLLRYFFREF